MKKNLSKKELREFSVIISILFALIFGFLLPIFHGLGIKLWPFCFSFIFLTIGILNPNWMKGFYFFWMKIGEILGWVNSKIILGLVFLFILIPISIVIRFTNYDPLSLKKKSLQTYKIYAKNNEINFKKIF